MTTMMRFIQVCFLLSILSITSNAFHIKSSVGSRLLGSHSQVTSRPLQKLPATALRPHAQHSTALSSGVLDDLESGVQLNEKKRGLVEQFVQQHGGKRVIQRILIANNGMAATKSILSMRQWAYMNLGDEKALEFVVMATRDDLNANAEFIRLADTFVEVPSGSNKNNYANVDLIVKIAEKEKVDAVWPGWGHASENPRLPETLKAKGITFIGPPSNVMAALGDKISANILAQTAKVPSIPWSGDGIESSLNAEGVIPPEVFNKACIFNVEQAVAMAEKIGYPVMIKASEGGGGKGIRKANSVEELRTNFIQVQNEVPGSPVFMMQLCTGARHLEVQIVGDEFGNAIALNGRDCSTQRRFQKIFEEGPPIIAPKEQFREMERAAQRLTQSIGYVGAGTVEYLYNPKTNKFFFLELNPRLQVEHPVTEGLSGCNLPAVQLQVAMGMRLDSIPEVKAFYGLSPDSQRQIDFMTEEYVYPKHHVIAARITAENPDEGFKPTSGRIERVKFQSTPKVWGYFSVGANGGIHEYADSQFGHLFATGATREEARKSLVLALKEIDVRGDVRTTVEYLIKLLETEDFKNNTIDTSWLDKIIANKTVSVNADPQVVSLSAAIFKAFSQIGSQTQDFLGALAKGQTSLSPINSFLSFPVEVTFDNIKYAYNVAVRGPNHFRIKINDQEVDVKLRQQPDKSLLCVINGENYQLYGQEEALGLRMKINGQTVMIPHVYNPSELRSDVTGKIVRFLHPDRSFVNKDEPYVEVEAMKMIMALKAGEAGVVTQHLSPGSIIGAGDLIASMQLQDLSKVKPIHPFTGSLSFLPPVGAMSKEEAGDALTQAISGYEVQNLDTAMNALFGATNAMETVNEIGRLLKIFVDHEKAFLASSSSSTTESEVVSGLVKAAKGDAAQLQSLLPTLIARRNVKNRVQAGLLLLRRLEQSNDKKALFGRLRDDFPALYELLRALSNNKLFAEGVYGPMCLAVKRVLDQADMPSFQARLDSLKRDLQQPKLDADALSRQSHLAVSVDLLVSLMRDYAGAAVGSTTDENAAVRKKAMEVYIRRVYRGHSVKDITISESAGGLKGHFSFTIRNDVDKSPLIRQGCIYMLSKSHTQADLQKVIQDAKKHLRADASGEMSNVLHIGFVDSGKDVAGLESQLKAFSGDLAGMGVKLVNIFLSPAFDQRVSYHSYISDLGYKEETLFRDMRPTLPALLEVPSVMKTFDLTRLPAVGRNSFLFLGKEKAQATAAKDAQQVLFLRANAFSEDSVAPHGAERIVLQALDEIERVFLDPQLGAELSATRLFVNVMPNVNLSLSACVQQFQGIMDKLVAKYATRLLKLRVDEIEVKMRVQGEGGEAGLFVPVRLVASSANGGWLSRAAYREHLDRVSGNVDHFVPLVTSTKGGPYAEAQDHIVDLHPANGNRAVQKKRALARKAGSTYAPDMLTLLEISVINEWKAHLDAMEDDGRSAAALPENLFEVEELVLDNSVSLSDLSTETLRSSEGSILKEVKAVKPKGVYSNKVGMLAWQVTIKTPQYPEGRKVVIVANDVTVQSGSFGVPEDIFFAKISQYSRALGLPKVFLSCNSGARIGLVEEVKPKFKVQFKDADNANMGFDYLYLTEEDHAALPAGTVEAEKLVHPVTKEVQYKLTSIIGATDGRVQSQAIGVENLRGSGMIAGETSRAYDEVFTLSYVTGRSVGIGAYLNRLGQRVIQKAEGPMILTGYSALNKLLGKEVYTSQDQLGGPQIMNPNGVTHQVVQSDQEGMDAVLQWLSYTPATATTVSPPRCDVDRVDRPVEFTPSKTPYDVRGMLAGVTGEDGSFVSGFLDRNSFQEYLSGWGKSVIAGRGRLGGINVGVIAVETRQVEQRIPADPSNPDSREMVLPQAGQVWYPDSAFKTAQAINDFNRGENLPLLIFANWRGFSGGTRDMYGEILKYGAMIVDALRGYKHPVFIYIPPFAELRGGAWVVLDPSINLHKIEMFADPQARGGILEPPGICEVKYRPSEQVQTMHRVDAALAELDEELAHADGPAQTRILAEIKARERALLPVYTQIAHEFADLHDRAGRMKAKGCVDEVVAWRDSRKFFYWRVLVRQRVERIKEDLVAASHGRLDLDQAHAQVHALLPHGADDEATAKWLDSHPDAFDGLLAAAQRL